MNTNKQKQGLAITSLVLGMVSLICFGILTGIPAIICGHIAHGRARKFPEQFGGAGLAVAGFVLGYVSFLTTLVLAGMLLPALAKARYRAESISCVSNMKQMGLSLRLWAQDNDERYPFNVSTNQGGTMELCDRNAEGFDRNAAAHFQVMSNELLLPRILVCPGDSKAPAADFGSLRSENVSYQLRSGTNIVVYEPSEVVARCPIHGNTLLCDGSVFRDKR